jgi:hypothetical protein
MDLWKVGMGAHGTAVYYIGEPNEPESSLTNIDLRPSIVSRAQNITPKNMPVSRKHFNT